MRAVDKCAALRRTALFRALYAEAFMRLQQEELISVDSRRLIVPDEQALAAFAGEG